MTINDSKRQLLPNVEPTNFSGKSAGNNNDSATTGMSSPVKLSAARVSPFIAALILQLAACAAGPNFVKPAAPDVRDYTATPLSTTASTPDLAGGQSQRFASGSSVSADWWTLFHSKPLDDLIEESLANNHDLKAAQAALSVARENVLAHRGVYYPNVSGSFSANRRQDPRGSLAAVPSTNAYLYNLFTPQVSVSYVPDVFGLNRRTGEALQAQQQAARYQMIATYTTLTANVAVTAIQAGAVQMQIDATRELIDLNSHSLQIVQYQFDKGYASGIDLAAQKSQLAQITATLPPLLKQFAQLRDLLAVLAGRYPSRAPDYKFELTSLQLPGELPVSLPSELVAQRPDVLQAEENMHSASAQIGIAAANRLPNIQLTADVGSTALAIDQVFHSGTGFWGLSAALTAPIFAGGTLLHQEHAAKAAYIQAAEQYRGTVLTAMQDVADTLAALEQDADALKAAAVADDAAKTTLELVGRQSQVGYVGYLALLSAEQAYRQARINLVQAQANRFADTAALYHALGGGWWHRAELAENNDGK